MNGSRLWNEYAEALGNLARAPEAAQRRRGEISAQEDRDRQRPDERLRAATQAKQELEDRLAQLDVLVKQTMHEHDVAAEGLVADVDVPFPVSVDAAYATIDRVEEQLRADADSLEVARRLDREGRERRRQQLIRLVAVTGAVVLVAVVVLIVFG